MFKGNSFVLNISILLCILIISISETAPFLKVLLSLLAVAFLFPVFRKHVFQNKMRKLKVALLTSMTFSIGLFFSSLPMAGMDAFSFITVMSFIVVLLYSLLGNLLYGLPVSILAEYLSVKTSRFRIYLSAFIHLGFGFATFFVAPAFFLWASICSALFFIWDEVTRRSYRKRGHEMSI
ncbi:hypothetical protein GLW07_13965 [Bacillus hwajinpoensis]|uniref:Uncharacterized protein n=1 Tax=Guptibacillus hwajinpoensis TaxID=208199 RepID=A0A845F0Z9_9BACL|nr:hypothetical protein [Pseudalkalibacillus hwajinpoensis]MYL64459.1 hypothetical protein [Pseudalkalibacillus hwajinpoensis]